jgi:ATP-binding cassette, subfamily F, member 3
VLDEPTNHLDLWARDALETALTWFDGTVLFVNHDRYFVNRVADHLLVIEPDRVRAVEGNYDSYQLLLGRVAVDASDQAGASSSPRAKSDKSPTQSATKRRFPYRKVADLEREVIGLETSIKGLQRELAEPSVLRDGDRARQIKIQLGQQQEALKTLYEHWEEATELNW